MTVIHTQVIGLEKLLSGFTTFERGLTRLRGLFEKFGQEFYSQETKLFALAPWKPLTPAYAKRKRAQYGDKPILRATDRLWRSLTQKASDGNVHRISDDSAEFGSAVPYGVFHHESRPPLAEPDEERYATIAGEYAAQLAEQAGFS